MGPGPRRDHGRLVAPVAPMATMHDPPSVMTPTQRLPASLTPLDVALAALLRGLAPVMPVACPLAEALGCIAAEMPSLEACPARDIAAADGWALRARDLVGASSYSPLPLDAAPVWVEAGDPMPAGCDCVLDADLLDHTGPLRSGGRGSDSGAGGSPPRQRHRRGQIRHRRRAAHSPDRSVERARGGTGKHQRPSPTPAPRRRSRERGCQPDGAT